MIFGFGRVEHGTDLAVFCLIPLLTERNSLPVHMGVRCTYVCTYGSTTTSLALQQGHIAGSLSIVMHSVPSVAALLRDGHASLDGRQS